MAGLAVILSALARVVWRDLRTMNSVATNNFFLFSFVLLQKSGVFPQVLLGLILLFPLSADPLKKIPSTRLRLWPLSTGQRVALRIASIWLSPAAWITIGLLLWAARPSLSLRFLILAVSVHLLGLLFTLVPERAPRMNPLRRAPPMPGRLGGLVGKNLREMLSVLDVYAAMLVALSGLIYRIASRAPEPDAFFGISLMVVLALSTYAQCLFGLESEAGLTRYRLLPLRGWEILLAKDISFLAIVVLLVLPNSVPTGLAAALMALAIGHHAAVRLPTPQTRRRFMGSPSIGLGIVQTVAMFGAGGAVYRGSAWLILPCVAFYLVSLWFYGREFERVL